MTTSRMIRTFSLDAEICRQLELRAQETGEKLSRIVDSALRAHLALAPSEREAEIPEPPRTRTESAILYELSQAGPGWHSGVDLALRAGCSFAIAERALKDLERRGKVFRWGDAREFSDGRPGGGTWGLKEPIGVIRALLRLEPPPAALWDVIGKLTLGIADAERVRAVIREEWPNLDDRSVESFRSQTEIDREKWARERARVG